MASENGDHEVDDIDPVEDEIIQGRSGKVTGIIYPPPDIRAVVDKTAQWVARNGKSFEERILNSEEGKSAKFNFMKPGDPYNAYYEHKIRMFEEGKEPPEKKPKITPVLAPEAAADGDGEGAVQAPTKEKGGAVVTTSAAATTVGKASVLGPIARAGLNKPSEPPHPHEFFMNHPESLNAMDVEIIKLTAQYTAASGRQFLAALAQKEQRNPIFEFLKPTHVLFSYFTTLVDAYIKILQPTDRQKDRVQDGKDRVKVLERVVHRWEYEKDEEEKKKSAQAEQEAERVAYQSVDWHDFVVVETITFAEDELLDVGMPGLAGEAEEEEAEEEEEEEDMDIDMEMEEDGAVPPPPPPPPSGMPPPPPPPPRPMVDMDTDETEIKVVSSYTPRVGRQAQAQPQMMLDPVTGKEVPISEVGEHMRIQFLDPRWREEQRRALEKKKESSLAEGTDIAANVRSFAKKRTDIFGTAEDEEREILEDQERFRNRQEEGNRIIWDGSIASAPSVQSAMMNRPPAAAAAAAAGGGAPQPRGGLSIGPSGPSFQGSGGRGGGGNMPNSLDLGPGNFVSVGRGQPPPPPPGHGGYGSFGGAGGGGGGPPPHFPPHGFPSGGMGGGMGPMGHMGMGMPPPHFGGGGPGGFPPHGGPPLPPYGGGGGGGIEDADMENDDEGGPNDSQAPSLLSEAEFAEKNPGAAFLSVQAPNDSSNPTWNLTGQLVVIKVPSVMATIKELKEQLSEQLGGMPVNKMQIKSPAQGFLKDGQSLASYNIGANSTIELLTKSRGGRR